MTHDIILNLPPVPIGASDANFEIYADGELLGQLRVSTGSIEWISRHKRRGSALSWTRFDDVMQKIGSERKVKRKPARRRQRLAASE